MGGVSDWPVLWGAVSSGRIPKDIQWPQPVRTWWGAHSVCKRSSPSPTLRPKPRPSWVTCPASYQRPINVPNPKPKIQAWGWKQRQKRVDEGKLQDWMGFYVKYPSLRDILKHLRAQHPSCPLAAAICTKLRRSSHFPGIPSHPAPPISNPVCADPPPGGWNSWQPCPWGLTSPILLLRYFIKQVWGWIKDPWTIWQRLAEWSDLTGLLNLAHWQQNDHIDTNTLCCWLINQKSSFSITELHYTAMWHPTGFNICNTG